MPALKSVTVNPAMTPLHVGWPEGVKVVKDAQENLTIEALCTDWATLAVAVYDANSVMTTIGRQALTPHAVALREISEWAYLIIVGSLTPSDDGFVVRDGKKTKWHWASMAGAMASVQEAGVTVLHVANYVDIPALVTMLAKRDRSASRIRAPKDYLFPSPDYELLTAIPGLGEDKAERLLTHVRGSVAAALVCLTGPVEALPAGIGPETRAEARSVLGLADGFTLELVVSAEPAAPKLVPPDDPQVAIAELFPEKVAA